VDLDAALGSGDNSAAIRDVIDAAAGVPVQVGGGVRSLERAEALFDAGADRVVAGTRAVRGPRLARGAGRPLARPVVLAADVLGDEVVLSAAGPSGPASPPPSSWPDWPVCTSPPSS
jgi:phosphoribosylformimino-5-aminoimidazole carboxamide ribotide isomerase